MPFSKEDSSKLGKEIYLELQTKLVEKKRAAEFSSDEEDPGEEATEVCPRESEVLDPSSLTDDELKTALLKHGVKAGPVVASTRSVYERKLSRLETPDKRNGAEKAVLYSDSEEEGAEECGSKEDKDSGSEQEEEEEMIEMTKRAQQEISTRPATSGNEEPSSKRNSRNASKPSEWSRSTCSQIPAGISRGSSVDQRPGLGAGMESRSKVRENGGQSNTLERPAVDQYRMRSKSLYYIPRDRPHRLRTKEPVKDILKDLFPQANITPTGIYATCRRPIKGAAQRPVEYAYPDYPVSPVTFERLEVERHVVPIHIQILFYVLVAFVLYLIHLFVGGSSVLDLLGSLTWGFDSKDKKLLQSET